MSFKGGQQKTTELTSDSQPITGSEDASNKPQEGYYKGFDRQASSQPPRLAFSGTSKLIASVLDESLSNLIATYLESYVKSHTEELKAIERLQTKARKES